ncbi:MAG: hypothetical protein Q8878_03360, partial [Bacillota bacterium]|nr:hypothetical protein [Bacillota bacterium]
ERVLPTFCSDAQKEEYISKMQTKGGITETIIRSLETGSPFDEALRKGVARSRELSLSVRELMSNF